MGSGSEKDWAEEARFWKRPARRICADDHLQPAASSPYPGHTMADHLAALRRYHAAVADAL